MFDDPRVLPTPAPDAVAMRLADHQELQALFGQYDRLVSDGAEGETRLALAETICVTLTVHITAEEELFYPAALGAMGAQDVLHEATAVRQGSRHLIADIVNMSPADPRLDATVKALGERVDRRMQEEAGRLFPKLRMTGMDLDTLGARIAERQGELMAEMEEAQA